MTIIFFFPKPIRKSRYKTFQLERLENEGHKILIIDATKYFNHGQKLPQEKIHPNTINITSKDDLSLLRLPEDQVLFITADTHLNNSSSLLKKIVRKEDILLSYSNKAFAPLRGETNFFKIGIGKMVHMLDAFLPLHLLKFYYKIHHHQIIPDYFLGSTPHLTPLKVRLTIKRNKRIFVHSDDMNEIINLKPGTPNSGKKTAVFLDQALPFQGKIAPGIDENFFPENYLEDYYYKLNRTLKIVQANLGVDEIIVALHPSSGFFLEEINKYIPSFKKEIWKTAELIRDSKFVLIHFSSAVGYAIYFDKPVIIMSDSLMLNNKTWKDAITYFNKNLGMPVINMDDESPKFDFSKTSNLKKYSNYKKRYLKDNHINENSYYYAINKIVNNRKIA